MTDAPPKPEDRPALRPGEVALPFDPGARTVAGLVFIGRIRTPWAPGDCPRNLRAARAAMTAEADGPPRRAWLEIAPPYRPGLEGLAPGMALMLLYWLGEGRRDLIRQAPRHRPNAAGVFALRSPVRPNPIGLACVLCNGLDAAAGVVGIDALDAFDGTALLDVKPWLPAVDTPPQP